MLVRYLVTPSVIKVKLRLTWSPTTIVAIKVSNCIKPLVSSVEWAYMPAKHAVALSSRPSKLSRLNKLDRTNLKRPEG